MASGASNPGSNPGRPAFSYVPYLEIETTRYFVTHQIKGDIAEREESNFDDVARVRINGEWEVCTDRWPRRIDAASTIRAKKLARLCFFEGVRVTMVTAINERGAMPSNELFCR